MAELLEKHPPDYALLNELAPTAEDLFNRHDKASKYWEPALYIPYDYAKSFKPDYQWSPDEFPLELGVRRALHVNLLTEDNLTYYSKEIDAFAGTEGIWGKWSRRWTYEEYRHSRVIRGFLEVSRAIDVRELEAAVKPQMIKAEVPNPPTTADGLVYVTLQELATRVSHLNTGKRIAEAYQDSTDTDKKALAEAGRTALTKVSSDENFHYLFYRDLSRKGFKIDPSKFVIAAAHQIIGFKMPGTGISTFKEDSKLIAAADIYNTEIHLTKVLEPAAFSKTGWDLEHVSGLNAEAEQARDLIFHKVGIMKKAIERAKQKRAAKTELDRTL